MAFKGSLGDRFRCHSSVECIVDMMLECIESLLYMYRAILPDQQFIEDKN